jgi:hypothetical protein
MGRSYGPLVLPQGGAKDDHPAEGQADGQNPQVDPESR